MSHYFGSEQIFLVNSEADFYKDAIRSARFVLIPNVFSEKLAFFGKVDLFINVNSMGEMKNSVLRYWFDLIQNKINPDLMVSIDRFLNTSIPGEHEWRYEEN